jgi:hypothetical protein
MPHKYALSLKIDNVDGEISVSGEFSDDEWDRLEAFLQYSGELTKVRFLHSAERGCLRISGEHDRLIIEAVLPPDWDEVIVFLHKLRPFILEDEGTSFDKVSGLLGRKLDHAYFRSLLKQCRRLYTGKIDQSLIQIWSNEELINSEKVLLIWLYAHEYHRDTEKREFIDGLHQMLPLDASKVMFLGLLLDKADAIFGLADLVRVVLGKVDRIKL